jgi:molybdopterin molybdotransferase
VVLERGTPMTPAAVGLAAGAGVSAVQVHRRPRVAIMATGDEIRGPGEPLGAAGLPDANGPGLRAMASAAGAQVVDLGIARDDLDDVLGRLRRGIAEADVIIVSGGVSVGPYDVVKRAFETVGRIDLWRVAVQPGKPFVFGRAGDTLLFGLPGNPVSSFVTFELFVRPALRRLAGQRRLLRETDAGVLLEPVTTAAGRRAYVRARADRDTDGRPLRDALARVRLHLAGGQGSHVLSSLAAADALAVVPETVEALPAGSPVELWWLDR